MRFDSTHIRNRDRLRPGREPGLLNEDHRFRRLNPLASLRWTPAAGVSVDAALAWTSRAPSAIELGCADPDTPCRLPNALVGDPPLDQMVARTVEAGLGLERGDWRARLGAFRTVNHGDVLFVAAPRAGFGYTVFGLGGEVRPARVDNLCDRDYATAAQLGATAFDAQGVFTQRPFADSAGEDDPPLRSSTFDAPGAPRSVRAGARFSF